MRGKTKREDPFILPLVLLPSSSIQCNSQILVRVVRQGKVLSSSTLEKFLQIQTDDDDHILDETHF